MNGQWTMLHTRDIGYRQRHGWRTPCIGGPSDILVVTRQSQDAIFLLEEGATCWCGHAQDTSRDEASSI